MGTNTRGRRHRQIRTIRESVANVTLARASDVVFLMPLVSLCANDAFHRPGALRPAVMGF